MKLTKVDWQERAYTALSEAGDEIRKSVVRVSPDPTLARAHAEIAISHARRAIKALTKSRNTP